MQTGKCFNDACYLIIGIKQGSDLPNVTVDGNTAVCMGSTDDAYTCDRNNSVFNSEALVGTVYYKYKISVSAENVRNITFNAGDCILTYVEIKVVAKE